MEHYAVNVLCNLQNFKKNLQFSNLNNQKINTNGPIEDSPIKNHTPEFKFKKRIKNLHSFDILFRFQTVQL